MPSKSTTIPIPTPTAGEAQQRERNQSKRNRKDSSSEISAKNSASEEASSSLFPTATTVSSTISTTSTTSTDHGALSAVTTLSTATLPFLSSPTTGTSDASTSSTEQRTLLLAIILPIILLLIILLACCFYRKRSMNAADNELTSEPKPSSTPISPPVPAAAAASIGISHYKRRSISSLSYTTESNDNSQFSHSTSSKEMLPREAPPFTAATFAAQSVHSSSQAQSIYSLYGGNSNSADSFMTDDLLKFGAGAAALAAHESQYSSSSSSSMSEKSVSERRRVDEGDYIADDAFHRASLVPSANSFVDTAPAVELDSQSDTKCNENFSNVSYDLPSKRTPLLTEQVPLSSLLALPQYSEDEEKENKELKSKSEKKTAFPIELKETVRGRFELSQHPRWMRKPQFVNPNTTPDFSSSIDGAHNEFDDDEFDLDDYVPPAPTSHVAIMNYTPKRKEEMRIANGDLIGIERQLSGEWCLGQNISQQRKRGLFPLSAVVAIKSGPSQAVRRGRFGAGSTIGK